ncbi:PD-(D/E)XK nuclease family protein [Sulfurovum sp. NBC37-1]|uniref:PDDEXK-like family protein n=1 Tax=Sulfurovum sp. (strain NBC37-1) TaxID=387093 RepID=UPI0001587980|nr:PD-(D/E)XK nuclease family protein [Sulfurovum sp. NBC37-1]BAF73239.1 conserved hypothetical protein [Sulfurovum sp. NBC37-1]
MEDREYKEFIQTTYERFKNKLNQKKLRGVNDYNLLTTVLKEHDEVRLHSRMIGSLLNPEGLHYQNTLFLDKFLNLIDLPDFFDDTQKVTLCRECENIDLYLTDGKKHIIIENKVYTGDQPAQIKRYIEKIVKKNPKMGKKDLVVIYLSIDRDKPTELSLGKEKKNQTSGYFEINTEKQLQYIGSENNLKDRKFNYKSIHYGAEILNWLKVCKEEIENITNLNLAIQQYIDVIKMLTNTYTGGIKMEKIKFAKEHYETLVEFDKMMKEYIDSVKEKAVYALGENDFNAYKIEEWENNDKAIRIKNNKNEWGPNTNIALVLKSNGSFSIIIYVYDRPEVAESKLAMLGRMEWEGKIGYFRVGCYKNLNDVYEKIKTAAEELNKYYKNIIQT